MNGYGSQGLSISRKLLAKIQRAMSAMERLMTPQLPSDPTQALATSKPFSGNKCSNE